MINIGRHPLTIGVPSSQVPSWSYELFTSGRRDAAFVDTGYLRALLDERDQYHSIAAEYFSSVDSIFYTSGFVLSEATRQMAKARRVAQGWRWERVERIKELTLDSGTVLVVTPPQDIVSRALSLLVDWQKVIVRLDLCDVISILALDVLEHRRVVGFDSDFAVLGATMEP